MKTKGDQAMGRFSVQLQIANYVDLELARRKKLAAHKVRRTTISGVVDTGASRLVLPKKVAEQLGLRKIEPTKVKYADGRRIRRDTVEGAHVELLGRSSVFSAIVEPARADALIGALVLEELDFLVDPRQQRLYPRDPDSILSEIE